MHKKQRILLTGATGYVGGRLLQQLEKQGHEIHCLVRNKTKLGRVGPNTSVFEGDLLERSSMSQAFEQVDTAYFMVHLLQEKHDFQALELKAAENFASMARAAGVSRIIYLGGLGNEKDDLSPHLKSRHDVGTALRASGILTVELRASIVLGNGSLSFNLIRDLAEHLPFMVMPKWVSMKAQPIGIRDLLDYLVQSLDIPLEQDEIVEIGGADQVSYRDLMQEYARQRGIRRIMIPVPVLTPWLSSHWLSLFTEVDSTIGRKLIEGIKTPTVVHSTRAQELFDIKPVTAAEAIHEALCETGNITA